MGLAGAEALTGDLFLLMLSGGAAGRHQVNLMFDDSHHRRCRLPGGLDLLLLVLVRPVLRQRSFGGTRLPNQAWALEGKIALVLNPVVAMKAR